MSDPKDTGPFTMPSGPHPPAPASAKDDLAAFVAEVRRATAAAKKLTAKINANTVTVQPGGRTFSTVTAALNSITDASKSRQYVVEIGAGTYNELVTCKPWVFLSGEGADQTIIAAPAQSKQTSAGTVIAASNSAIQNCAVQATTGSAFADLVAAVLCQSAVNFDIENCALSATDPTKKVVYVIPLAIAYPGAPASQVNISYTTVTANGGVFPVAVFVNFGAYAHGMESTFVSENGSNPGWGGTAYSSSTLLVEDCTVQGEQYSLNVDDQSKVTANHCTLVGPVAPGVVVNP